MARIYLDTSAAFKLVAEEPESGALRGFLTDFPEQVSSRLLALELARAIARLGESAGRMAGPQMERLLPRLILLALDENILTHAVRLGPRTLRSLDAIHLASALAIPNLTGIVVYDRRLAEAAGLHGLPVYSPGVVHSGS